MTRRRSSPKKAGARRITSNEARSAETRRKLIEGAISCIQEFGYHGTTLAKICRRAGVSRGAVQHHFGEQKVNLIAATAAEVYRQLQSRYVNSMGRLESKSPAEAARVLFADLAELFETAESMTLIEIWMASRGDQELANAVLPTIQKIDQEITGSWDQRFSSLGRGDLYRGIGRSLSSGLPIELLIHGDTAFLKKVATFVGELIARDIDDPAAPA